MFGTFAPQQNSKQTRRNLFEKKVPDNMKFKPFDRPLTSFRYYSGLPQKLKIYLIVFSLQIKAMLKQESRVVSRFLKVCRVTGMKSILLVSINASKLGNPVFFLGFGKIISKLSSNYVINLMNNIVYSFTNVIQLRKAYSFLRQNKNNFGFCVCRGQDDHQAYSLRSSFRPNWSAYKICYNNDWPKIHYGTRSYSTKTKNRVISRPLVNKQLNHKILARFISNQWLTPELKQELIEFISKCQCSLAEISKKQGMYSKDVNRFFEKYIHNLLFQVFAIECLSTKRASLTAGSDYKVLTNSPQSKLDLLYKLKKFRTNPILPARRIQIPKNDKKTTTLSIPSILDTATQQLVLLLLDPIIEPHSDPYSFGFRKGRNQIIAIGTIQKNLQSKAKLNYLDTQYI